MLKKIYKNHCGKVSDKWSIYLDKYEEKLNNTSVSIMEQSNNRWSNSNLLPEEELVLLKQK